MKKLLLALVLLLSFTSQAKASWQAEDYYLSQIALHRPYGILTINDYYQVFPQSHGYVVRQFHPWDSGHNIWAITNLYNDKFMRVYSRYVVIANRWHYYPRGQNSLVRKMAVDPQWYSYPQWRNSDIAMWVANIQSKGFYWTYACGAGLTLQNHAQYWQFCVYSDYF